MNQATTRHGRPAIETLTAGRHGKTVTLTTTRHIAGVDNQIIREDDYRYVTYSTRGEARRALRHVPSTPPAHMRDN